MDLILRFYSSRFRDLRGETITRNTFFQRDLPRRASLQTSILRIRATCSGLREGAVACEKMFSIWGLIPDAVIKAESLDKFNSFIMRHSRPEFVVALVVAGGPGTIGLGRVGSGFLSILVMFVVGFVDVVAARAVGAVAFEREVEAGLGLVVVGDVGFLSDFLVIVGEGALGEEMVTLLLKGQYPFSSK